jgi:hypothetical protein
MDYLKIFVPYELLLAQRRAMVWGSDASKAIPNAYIGFYLVRLEPTPGGAFPSDQNANIKIEEHVTELLQKVLRDSDIPAKIGEYEHLAILRDVAPDHAYAVAQRFLTSATTSPLLVESGLRTCVGYLVYPLSPQPNFPVENWNILLELCRRMSHRGDRKTPASGCGLLRGPQMDEANIPESDLVPLAYRNLETLVKEEILQIQRIRLLPGE